MPMAPTWLPRHRGDCGLNPSPPQNTMSCTTARLSSVKPTGLRSAAPMRRAAATFRGPVVVRAGDLVETAKAAGFTTLVAAVEAAGLTATLKSAGPFTVLAPTNEAFAALPAGTLDRLLKPENKQELTNILLCVVSESQPAVLLCLRRCAGVVSGSRIILRLGTL